MSIMEIEHRLSELREALKIDKKKSKAAEIEKEMAEPDFWLNETNAQANSKELKHLRDLIKKYDYLCEIAQLATGDEISILEKDLHELEMYAYFSGKYDDKGAIINFYAGAGGVDAQDWTEMLLKMYLRWAESHDVIANIISESRGDEAGIKAATVEFDGSFIYGKLKGESGVHRLVRQSPFNAKNLRQTSFSLVEVMPEIESEGEVEIDSKDLRVDVYRSGGHGGQSVNTTDSAVRITHTPTGIVVTCQNERSQLQNKETAMKVLRSRLAKLLLEQHKEKVAEIRGEYSSPSFSNQIRSYVLHPYKMVKDHRTEHESKNPDEVLLGDIDKFIESEIKWAAKSK